MLFDQHEIVFAEGVESESFHPGAVGMDSLSKQAQAEVCSLFSGLLSEPESYGKAARLSVKSFEARILAA
jgi:hypothetical protein